MTTMIRQDPPRLRVRVAGAWWWVGSDGRGPTLTADERLASMLLDVGAEARVLQALERRLGERVDAWRLVDVEGEVLRAG